MHVPPIEPRAFTLYICKGKKYITEMATGKFISPFMSDTMNQQLDDGNALQFTLPEASLFEDSLGDNFHSKALEHGGGGGGTNSKLLENANSRVDLDDSLCGDIDEAETQLQVDQLDIDTVPPKVEDKGPDLDDSLYGGIDEAETQLQMDQSDVSAAPPIVVKKGPSLDDSLCDDDEKESQLQVEQVNITHLEPPKVNFSDSEVADGSKVAERAPSLDDSLCGDPEETQANEADVEAPGEAVPSMNDFLCYDDNADETQLPVDHAIPPLLEDEAVTSKVTHISVASPAMINISGASSTASELTEALSESGEKESGIPQNASAADEQISDKKTSISTDGDKCEEKKNGLQHFSQSSSPVSSEVSLPAASKGSISNTTPKPSESSHSKVVPSFGKKKKGFVPPTAIASTPANSGNKQSTSIKEAKTVSADSKSKPGSTEEKQAGECGVKEKVASPQTDKEKPETNKENSSTQGAQKPKFSPPAPKPTDTTNNLKSSLPSEKEPVKLQKKNEQTKKKAEQGAKKQENQQKGQVSDQKKQEKEQKRLEKEQKKAEKERLKEEKRLEQERKKAEREQKKMEKELKKMEREQKKAQKQPAKVKGTPQKGDTKEGGDSSSMSKADKTATEPEVSLQETAQSEAEGSHTVPPSEPNCSATHTLTDETTDSISTENVDDSVKVQDGQEGDPTESETNENDTTAPNDASDQPLTREKASNVAEEDAVQTKEKECGSPPIEQQHDERETNSNLDSNGCTIKKQSSQEKSGDNNTDLEDSKHGDLSNADQSNTNTEKSSAEPQNTLISEKDPVADKKKEQDQKKKTQNKDDKTLGKKTKSGPESKKSTTKNGAQTSKGNKSQGAKATGKTQTGKKEKHSNPPSRSRKRKATSDSGSSTTEESDSAPEPKRQRSKPTNYSGPVWVQCEKCQKWRQLRDCRDPSKLPEQWECSMNTDTAYNSCSAPEEQWSDLGDSQEFVESPFIPGSIIWAKMDGYPWWPAMVEEDPDEEAYYEMGRGGSNVPARYHVVFFDKPVCRAWISTLHTQIFAGECDINEPLSIPQKYKRALKENVKQAQRALNMPIVERLAQFTFSKRYRKNTNNRKRKHSDDDDEECTHTAHIRSSSAKSGSRKSARLSGGATGEEKGQEKGNANTSHCDGGEDRDPEEMASPEVDQETDTKNHIY